MLTGLCALALLHRLKKLLSFYKEMIFFFFFFFFLGEWNIDSQWQADYK